MKLSKLLKKITVAVSVLMIAGMLAACSSPSGSSSGSGSGSNNGNNNSTQQPGSGGDGGNDAGKDDVGLTVMYGDTIISEGIPTKNKSNLESAFKSGTDYTVSGSTYTLTSKGLDEWIKLQGANDKSPVSNPVAIVVYQKNSMMAVNQEQFAAYGSMLTEGTDYTLLANKRIILLTKAGYDKIAKGISSGNDGEQSKITYKDSNTEMTMTVPAKYLDSALNQYGLTEGTDYTKDSSGKNATLTKSGYDKIQAKSKKN